MNKQGRSNEEHLGRRNNFHGKGVRSEYHFGEPECGHLWDCVLDGPVTLWPVV